MTNLEDEDVVYLDPLDEEGSVDHGEDGPDELEAERGYRLREGIDPDDDESGSDPE